MESLRLPRTPGVLPLPRGDPRNAAGSQFRAVEQWGLSRAPPGHDRGGWPCRCASGGDRLGHPHPRPPGRWAGGLCGSVFAVREVGSAFAAGPPADAAFSFAGHAPDPFDPGRIGLLGVSRRLVGALRQCRVVLRVAVVAEGVPGHGPPVVVVDARRHRLARPGLDVPRVGVEPTASGFVARYSIR